MVYDKNGKVIKSAFDYDFWHMKPQQAKFNSEFNSWFSHFQMNDDKLPEYKEGNDWVDINKGKPWMEELCKEYNIYPVGPRECAAFYMALKSIGEINEQGQPINNSRQITSAVTSGLKITNVTVYPKWICETVRSTIYVGANINGKDFVFPMMPCYGNTPDGVDCDECLVTKLNGGWGNHADYDRYAERINHVAKGGSSKAYGLNIMSDVLKSVPKENQKDFGFTGQYYSTKNVPRAFKSKLMELYDNGSLEPEFLEAIGLGTITSSKTITSNKEPADMDMAYQLEGYIESDGQLYTQMIVPVIKNLERKVKKGIYDYDKSLIMWEHVADEGAKRYVKELGGPAYNVATRKEVAKKLSSYYEENYMGDNPITSSLNKNDKQFIKGLINDSSIEDPSQEIENYTYECEDLEELPEGTSREEFFNELMNYFNELDSNGYYNQNDVGRVHSNTVKKMHPKLWKITNSRAESCIEILEETLKHIEKENPSFSGNLYLDGDICYLSFSQNGSEKWTFYIDIGDCRYTDSGKLIPNSYYDSTLKVIKPEIEGYIDFNDFNKLPDMIYTIMDTNPKELNEIR